MPNPVLENNNPDQYKNNHTIIWFLGVIGIILSVGVCVLTYVGSKIDGGLFTMAGGVLGSLGTMLQNQRQRGSDPAQTTEPVPVTNVPGSPLETVSAEKPADSPPNAG